LALSLVEHGGEQAFGTCRAKLLHRARQTHAIHFAGLGEGERKDRRLVFRQPVKVVKQIDQKDFFRQVPGHRRSHPEIIDPAIERELAMPLMVVDHRLVVKLGRADAKAVKRARRNHQEAIIAEKGLDQLLWLVDRRAKGTRLAG